MGIHEDIAAFEQKVSELIVKYEQYFLGIDKQPLQLLDDVEKSIRRFMGVSIVNTMLKFRYNSAVARLNSYKQYWNRINTMIESGKYSRERFKMEIHQQREKLQPQPPQNSSEVEQLYRQYIDARRSCKMTAESITPEMVASLIEKQKPAIMKKYNCQEVEFKVVIEGGQPKIKVRPKN